VAGLLSILYSADIRPAIYSAIDVAHCQFCKLTKTKGAFPNENCLMTLLYMVLKIPVKKGNFASRSVLAMMPIWNWKTAFNC